MFSVNVISIIDDPKLVESTSVEICIDNNLPKVLAICRIGCKDIILYSPLENYRAYILIVCLYGLLATIQSKFGSLSKIAI